MFAKLRTWAEFVKLSHTIFALPFALAGMVVAARENRGWPGWEKFVLILVCMVCARTCAMAFNRIVDRRFDALNPRTANRPLPAGKVSLPGAMLVWIVSAAGLIVASYFINRLCFYLSPLAILIVCFYSLTKRFTAYTHVYLGIALALAPLGAWLAVKGFEMKPWDWLTAGVLAIGVVLWLIGFDIIYALQDYEFDRKHGLRSLVVEWGPKNALGAAFLSHLLMCGVLLLFGVFLCKFKIAFMIGWILIVLCIVMEHFIARRRSLNWVQTAFFKLNAVISVIFFVVVTAEVIFQGGFWRGR